MLPLLKFRLQKTIPFRMEEAVIGYDTLAREFQDNVEKVGEKIRKLLLTSPDNIQDHFARRYFRMEPESLENHMKLLADLTLVKNWMLDGKSLPT